MRMILTSLTLALAMVSSPAMAACELATTPCYRDSTGNTYRTEQNLGGGYNTYRNGVLNSQTQQNLSGGYTETRRDGQRYYYDKNPFE